MQAPKTDDLIALICKAATEKYREDKVRPGIQIAHIPESKNLALQVAIEVARASDLPARVLGFDPAAPSKSEPAYFYVALHRYPNAVPFGSCGSGSFSKGREIVHTAKHEDLDRAVQLLAMQLLPVEAQAELADAIRGLK